MLLRAGIVASSSSSSSPFSGYPLFRREHLNKPQSNTLHLHSIFKIRCPANHSPHGFLLRCSSSSSPPLALGSSPLRHLEPYLLEQWRPVLTGWLCGAVSALCLSKAVPRAANLPSALAAGPVYLAQAGLPLAALALGNSAATYFQQAFIWEASLGAVSAARADVFDHVIRRDLAFFEGSEGVPAGDIAYRITAEASDVADMIFTLLNMVVPDTLQLVVMATNMVTVSPVLSMASVLVIPCLCLAIAYLGHTLRKLSQRAHASVAKLSSYLNEVLPSILIVKANNGEVKESDRFRALVEDDFVNLLKKRKMKALIPQLIQILYIVGLSLVCAGSVMISGGSFDCSAMVSFVASLALIVEPIKGIGKAYNELKQGEPAVERLFYLTNHNPQENDETNAVGLEKVSGDIKFCNVKFRYGDKMPLILNGLNLHIKSKETVALIGPSGGGKTTLTKLLLRLYNPTSGHILIDDLDIRSIQLRSLRKHIGFVSQDIGIFSGTIAENIAYKDSLGAIDMEKVEHAAKISNADEFVRALPSGFDTDVGPKGSRFSGGQRQRLAIARALYQESSILILDEATSALDARSEGLVRQALERLMADHTILIIAHRVETILMADRIILLDGSRLEEISRSAFLSQDGYWGPLTSSSIA